MSMVGNRTRWIFLVVCCVEIFCTGGLQYGWNALVPIWKTEGIYGCANASKQHNISTSLLAKTNHSCNQNFLLSTAYVTTTITSLIVYLPCGVFFDKFKVKITKFTNGLIFFSACMFMSFVSPTTPGLIFPGAIIFGITSCLPYLVNMGISFAFPNWSSLITSIMSGLFDSSAVVFQFIAYAYGDGISLMTSFIFVGVFGLVLKASNAIFLLPKTFWNEDSVGASETNEKDEDVEVSTPSIFSVTLSRHYLLQLLWFSCMYLRFQYFLGALPQLLQYRFPHRSDVRDRLYGDVNFFLVGGAILSPLPGFCVDTLKHWMTPKDEEVTQDTALRAIGIVEALGSTFAILLSALTYVNIEAIFYVLFGLLLFCRTFLFVLTGTFAIHYFPVVHFGKLFSLMFVGAIIPTACQFALLKIPVFWTTLVMTIVSAVSFVQPINLILGNRVQQNEVNVSQSINEKPQIQE